MPMPGMRLTDVSQLGLFDCRSYYYYPKLAWLLLLKALSVTPCYCWRCCCSPPTHPPTCCHVEAVEGALLQVVGHANHALPVHTRHHCSAGRQAGGQARGQGWAGSQSHLLALKLCASLTGVVGV